MSRWLVLFLALLVSACSLPMVAADRTLRDSSNHVTLRVENDAFTDVTIYLVRSGVRQRLGYVPAMTESDFRVMRADVIGHWKYEVQPLGTRNTPVYTEYDIPPAYGFYRFRGEGIPISDQWHTVELNILNEVNMSHIGMVW